MRNPVNLMSISRATAMRTNGPPYDPGGFRTHDLRIKRSSAQTFRSNLQSVTCVRVASISVPNARTGGEEKQTPVTEPSFEKPTHKGDA